MAQLTEEQARAALRESGAAAAASPAYAAHREVGGWAFIRRADAGDALIGEVPYVVSDAGRVADVPLTKAVDQVLRELNHP